MKVAFLSSKILKIIHFESIVFVMISMKNPQKSVQIIKDKSLLIKASKVSNYMQNENV